MILTRTYHVFDLLPPFLDVVVPVRLGRAHQPARFVEPVATDVKLAIEGRVVRKVCMPAPPFESSAREGMPRERGKTHDSRSLRAR